MNLYEILFTTRDGENEYAVKQLVAARNLEECEQIAQSELEDYYGDEGLFEQDDNGVWCCWDENGLLVTYIETIYPKPYDFIWGTDGEMYEVRHDIELVAERQQSPVG